MPDRNQYKSTKPVPAGQLTTAIGSLQGEIDSAQSIHEEHKSYAAGAKKKVERLSSQQARMIRAQSEKRPVYLLTTGEYTTEPPPKDELPLDFERTETIAWHEGTRLRVVAEKPGVFGLYRRDEGKAEKKLGTTHSAQSAKQGCVKAVGAKMVVWLDAKPEGTADKEEGLKAQKSWDVTWKGKKGKVTQYGRGKFRSSVDGTVIEKPGEFSKSLAAAKSSVERTLGINAKTTGRPKWIAKDAPPKKKSAARKPKSSKASSRKQAKKKATKKAAKKPTSKK